jgi:hypothetical protein
MTETPNETPRESITDQDIPQILSDEGVAPRSDSGGVADDDHDERDKVDPDMPVNPPADPL